MSSAAITGASVVTIVGILDLGDRGISSSSSSSSSSSIECSRCINVGLSDVVLKSSYVGNEKVLSDSYGSKEDWLLALSKYEPHEDTVEMEVEEFLGESVSEEGAEEEDLWGGNIKWSKFGSE